MLRPGPLPVEGGAQRAFSAKISAEEPAHFFKKLNWDLSCSGDFTEFHVSYLITRDRRHPAKPSVVNQIHRSFAEFDCDEAIVGSGYAAALHVPWIRDPYLKARFRFENCGKSVTDTAQLLMSKGI